MLGLRLPLSGFGCCPPTFLLLAGDGSVRCWLALLWYLFSPFFCEQAGLGCYLMLTPSDCPQGIQAWSLSYAMHPMARTSGLLLCWELHIICEFYLFIFPPGYVALWDSKTPPQTCSWEDFLVFGNFFFRTPSQDGSPSLTLLSLFLSFIYFLTSFWRQWAAFLGAWYPLSAFRSCFVEFAQSSSVLLMNLWERKWSPCPIPPPS